MAVFIKKRRNLPEVDIGALRRKAKRLLELLKANHRELSILLTDDQEMRDLNHTYRKKNRTTDVLSFSQQEGDGAWSHPDMLGDVVISVPTAQQQAHEHNCTLTHELIRLLVHGVLHLEDYDHEKAGDNRTKAMQTEQKKLLTMLGV